MRGEDALAVTDTDNDAVAAFGPGELAAGFDGDQAGLFGDRFLNAQVFCSVKACFFGNGENGEDFFVDFSPVQFIQQGKDGDTSNQIITG